MREHGWIEGRTIAIEYRWAEGRSERFAEIAAEFVQLKVDVIVTAGTAPVIAAKQATSVIPIVFADGGDPVGTGLVASLARPGGNVTGQSNQSADIAGKRLELLREVVPDLRRLAIMANIGGRIGVLEMAEVQAVPLPLASRSLHLKSDERKISRPPSRAQRPRRCTLCSDRPTRGHQPDSNQHLGTGRETADDAWYAGLRRSGRSHVLWSKLPGAVSARRRLCRQNSARGEAGRPTVEQPTKFDLFVNMKTAKALGLTIPEAFLRASIR